MRNDKRKRVIRSGSVAIEEEVKVRGRKSERFILLRASEGIGYLSKLKGDKLHILIYMSYYVTKYNNLCHFSRASKLMYCKYMGISEKTFRVKMRELEEEMYIVEVYPHAYMVNPRVIMQSGYGFERDKEIFDKCVGYKIGKQMKESGYAINKEIGVVGEELRWDDLATKFMREDVGIEEEEEDIGEEIGGDLEVDLGVERGIEYETE